MDKNRFKEEFVKLFSSEFFKIALLVMVQVIVIQSGVKFFNHDATKNANLWLAADNAHFSAQKELVFSDYFKDASAHVRQRLQQQYTDIRNRAYSHLEIMKYYYARYYMAIAMTTLSGLFAAVSLVFITRNGWANSSPYLITIFVVMSSSAALYGSFPSLFEQKKNIDENKKSYSTYVALEKRMLSYIATGEDSDKKLKPVNEFIHDMDITLSVTHRIPVELNPTAIPDASTALGQTINGVN